MSASRHDPGDLEGALAAYESAPTPMLACSGPDLVVASANAAARAVAEGWKAVGKPVREVAERVLATGRSETVTASSPRQAVAGRESRDLVYALTVSPWRDADDSVRGVLVHGTEVQDSLLALLADENLGEELETVIALQDAMLPQWLPVLPRMEIAGSYLLGPDEGTAGGDWFDVVEMPDGRVGLVVGDVVGHGVAAAAAMGQLRSVSHERLGHEADLRRVMEQLEDFARTVPEAEAATVSVVALDPATGELEYCTAGHPPPLVVDHGTGRARHLPGSGAGPLATAGAAGVSRDRLGEQEVLVLYTDGIVHRPGHSVTSSTVELGQVAADAATGWQPTNPQAEGCADRVCAEMLEAMTGRTGYDDDIALLVAARRGERPRELRLELEADEAAGPAAVREVSAWLGELRVRELDHVAVQHAVDELVVNAVTHAYLPGESAALVCVHALLLESGELRLTVQDWGRWREPTHEPADATRGLAIARGMVDRLDIDTGSTGTVVTLGHRLSRPARMLTGSETEAGSSYGEPDRPFELRSRHGRMRVAGPLDGLHLPYLREALRDSGAHRLVLDLSEVTLLCSAGVQTLYAARRESAQRGQQLVLFAPPGSPAQHVLEVVRLPYSLTDPDVDRRDEPDA